MTPLILAGSIAGLGIFFMLVQFLPAHPHLGDAMNRLSATNLQVHPDESPTPDQATRIKVGRWVETRIAARLGLKPPQVDLQLLAGVNEPDADRRLGGVSAVTADFYAQKLIASLALGGLVLSMSVLAQLAGIPIAWQIPSGAIVLAMVAGWFSVDLEVRTKAAEAREDFAHAVVSYIQMVTISREASIDTTGAMDRAAALSDGWMFVRIREELLRAKYARTPAWEGLEALATRIGVSELRELANILRLAGTKGASVNDNLLAQSAALRERQLTQHRNRSKARTEAMKPPGVFIGLIFVILIGWPFFMAIYANAP